MKSGLRYHLTALAAVLVMLGSHLAGTWLSSRTEKQMGAVCGLGGLRTELLLLATHVDDLVTARQRNWTAEEREALRLIDAKLKAVESIMKALDWRMLPVITPTSETNGNSELLVSLDEQWSHVREAARNAVIGQQVLHNRDEIRRRTIRLVHNTDFLVEKTQQAHSRNVRLVRWVGLACFAVVAALFLLLIAQIHLALLRPLRQLSDRLRLLSTGNLQAETHMPLTLRGQFMKIAEHTNAFMDRFRRADQTKDRFLATMSHEIRTPMNGVVGFLDNLRETDLNERQRQYVRLIDSSARSLLNVINEILDFSKLSSGKMELEEVAFDLSSLLQERVAVGRQIVRGKRVKVSLEMADQEPLIIRSDPTRLRQVLDNLVSNAAKFTEGGEILLKLQRQGRNDGKTALIFSVTDTGIGISEDRIPRLFEAFTQAESSTTRRFGGTGLGLRIAYDLVQLMGGRLNVASEVGKGTTFDFTIVVETAKPEEQVRLSDHYTITLSKGALRKFWALLVDDTPTNLFLMETICQSIGLPYRTATNGQEAVDMATKNHFDLIFMDIQMPVMDGYTAIRRIRELDDAESTQIIALTASAFQEDVDQALGVGSTGFIAKPFERNHLLLCIAEYLGIPFERHLRDRPDSCESEVDVTVRRMYDFMREQYRIGLGEIKMVLAQSVADWRPLLNDIRAYAKQNDWDRIRPIMHKLKGQLSSIGLPHHAESAATFNAAIHGDETEGLREQLDEFADELAEIFSVAEREITLQPTEPEA
ncbi:MAG: response regulator [Lentisphaeria bacterium]|nr:response regulator [Lentisphaeria bacterium]